jgi:hypothetical protein
MVGKHSFGLLALVALGTGCGFPTPSEKYSCEQDSDCDPDRMCSDTKYCVERSSMADGGAGSDAGGVDASMIDADPFAATRAACMAAGYTMEPTTGGLYRVVSTGATWTVAKPDCEDDVVGATHIITLSTDIEVTYDKTAALDGWIGWIDRPTEGTWHVLTNEVPAINYSTYWRPGRPDGGNSENCSVYRSQGIDDVDCPSQQHPYICECDGLPVLP